MLLNSPPLYTLVSIEKLAPRRLRSEMTVIKISDTAFLQLSQQLFEAINTARKRKYCKVMSARIKLSRNIIVTADIPSIKPL